MCGVASTTNDCRNCASCCGVGILFSSRQDFTNRCFVKRSLRSGGGVDGVALSSRGGPGAVESTIPVYRWRTRDTNVLVLSVWRLRQGGYG